MQLQEKWELVNRRIAQLRHDLKGVYTQSDEVIYLLQDIDERLAQCTRYEVVLANELPVQEPQARYGSRQRRGGDA